MVTLSEPAKPNFLIAGAPRCGTTAMYLYLKQHPEIYLSVLKEPHFFGSDLTSQPHTVRNPEIYSSLFARSENTPRIGEGSVWYLRSQNAAREIYAFNPEMKILIMLRDPVDMMRSLHALYLRTGNEELGELEEALAAESARASGRRLPPRHYFPEGLQYRPSVAYAEQVERYLNVFDPRQVHVVLYEEFRARPLKILTTVAEFLGIDATFRPELDLERAQLLIRDRVLPQLKRAHPEIQAKLRAWYHHHSGPRTPLSPTLRKRLRDELRPGIARLAALIGRDLQGLWGER